MGLPCQLQIFSKIGAVVCGVTLYALLYTLFPLPTLLMTLGPCGHEFKSVQDWAGRLSGEQAEIDHAHVPKRPLRRRRSESETQRRYVLNMPSRGMSERIELDNTGMPGVAASRTKITLTG